MPSSIDSGRMAIYRQLTVMNNITNSSLKKEISQVDRDLKYRLREIDHEMKVFVKEHHGSDVKRKTRRKRGSTSHSLDMDQILKRLEKHRLTDNWVTGSAGYDNQTRKVDDFSEPETGNSKRLSSRSEQKVDRPVSPDVRRTRESCFNVLITDTKVSSDLCLPSVKTPWIGSPSNRRKSDTFVMELKSRIGDIDMKSFQELDTKFENGLDNITDIDSNIDRLCVEGPTRNRSVSLPTISKNSNVILNQNSMDSHRSKTMVVPVIDVKGQNYNYGWAQAGTVRSSAGVCMGKVIRDLAHGIPYRDLADRQPSLISDLEWSRLKACRYLRHRKAADGSEAVKE